MIKNFSFLPYNNFMSSHLSSHSSPSVSLSKSLQSRTYWMSRCVAIFFRRHCLRFKEVWHHVLNMRMLWLWKVFHSHIQVADTKEKLKINLNTMRIIIIFYGKSFRLAKPKKARRKTFSHRTQENVSKLSSRELQCHKIDRAAIANDCLFSIIYIQRSGNGGKHTNIAAWLGTQRNVSEGWIKNRKSLEITSFSRSIKERKLRKVKMGIFCVEKWFEKFRWLLEFMRSNLLGYCDIIT